MTPESGGAELQGGETLDSRVLAELRVVGGDSLVRELMVVFAECTPDRLRSAEESLATGDLEGTATALHSLRSASGTIGASRLAELAGRLERAARGEGTAELTTQLPELRLEAEQVLATVRRLAVA